MESDNCSLCANIWNVIQACKDYHITAFLKHFFLSVVQKCGSGSIWKSKKRSNGRKTCDFCHKFCPSWSLLTQLKGNLLPDSFLSQFFRSAFSSLLNSHQRHLLKVLFKPVYSRTFVPDQPIESTNFIIEGAFIKEYFFVKGFESHIYFKAIHHHFQLSIFTQERPHLYL